MRFFIVLPNAKLELYLFNFKNFWKPYASELISQLIDLDYHVCNAILKVNKARILINKIKWKYISHKDYRDDYRDDYREKTFAKF